MYYRRSQGLFHSSMVFFLAALSWPQWHQDSEVGVFWNFHLICWLCLCVSFQNKLYLVLSDKSTEESTLMWTSIYFITLLHWFHRHSVIICSSDPTVLADSYLFKKMLTPQYSCSTIETLSVTIATLFIIFIHMLMSTWLLFNSFCFLVNFIYCICNCHFRFMFFK